MKDLATAERQLASAAAKGRDISTASMIKRSDFQDRIAGLVWAAAQSLSASGKRINPVSIRSECRSLEKSSDIVEKIDLVTLASFDSPYTSEADIKDAVEVVLRASRLRRLQDLASGVARECKGDRADPDKLANVLMAGVSEIESTGSDELLTMDDVIRNVAEDIKRRSELMESGGAVSITTGLTALDRALGGGMEPGMQYVIGARPKMGKTALAMTIMTKAAQSGVPVLMISLEMSKLQLGRRFLAANSGVKLPDLKLPKKSDWEKIFSCYQRIKDLPIRFSLTRADVYAVASRARRWKRTHKLPGVIVVDYLQLMDERSEKGGNREREIAEMSRGLKLLGLELECATIVLSQLNRGLESRDNKRPTMSDLRESGSIEQDADAVLMLYRDHVYNAESDPRDCEIILAAQREGETGGPPIKVKFEGEHTRFLDAL